MHVVDVMALIKAIMTFSFLILKAGELGRFMDIGAEIIVW